MAVVLAVLAVASIALYPLCHLYFRVPDSLLRFGHHYSQSTTTTCVFHGIIFTRYVFSGMHVMHN